MVRLEVEYLSNSQLEGFSNYKYNSIDSSPLSKYVMHPFWDRVVKLCPRCIAPNALTLTGFSLTVLNFVIVSFYDYNYEASSLLSKPLVPAVPRFVWLLIAILLFTAHTLDGIDGKQARRLGMSGPLGELFDHGLDSWTSYFIPMTLYSAMGRHEYSVPPWRMMLALWNVLISFLLSHWEKYVTGVLFLPWGYDFSQLSVLMLYLVTYFGDYTVWKFSLVSAPDGTAILTPGHVIEVMLWAGSLGAGLPVTFYNIYRSYTAGKCCVRGVCDAVVPIVSPLALLAVTCLWARYSPSDVMNSDLRLFTFMIGVVFSNISCRLIVAQMSGSRCEAVNRLLLLVCVCAAAAFMLPSSLSVAGGEMLLLRALTALVTLSHIHYGVCVVRQMGRHFSVPLLTVVQKQSD